MLPAKSSANTSPSFILERQVESGWPQRELEIAASLGRFADEGWRVRKDGTQFWASVVITALRAGNNDELRGFSKVTRDLSERRALEQRTQDLNKELRARMAQLTTSRSQLELRNIELQRLSAQLVHIQDEERRRLARELHDDLGQVLAALKMNLDTAKAFESRNDTIQLAEQAIAKVRNVSYLLHPPLLDESGLLPAVHLFLEGFRKRSGLQIVFDSKPMPFPRINSEIEISIFRIIQESSNEHPSSFGKYRRSHRNSPATRPDRRQSSGFRRWHPSRDNDGELQVVTGVGISGMKERLKQMGGEVRILRAEPGTLVEAIVPLFS